MLWFVRISALFIAVFIAKILFIPTLFTVELKLATDIRNPLHQKGIPYIECAFSNLEYTYQTVWIPSEWAQLVTERGEYDGYFMSIKSDQRDYYAMMSEPFVSVEWLYVVRKNSGITPADPNFSQRIFATDLASRRLSWLENKVGSSEILGNIVSAEDSVASLNLVMSGFADVNLIDSAELARAIEILEINPGDYQTFVASTFPMGIYFGKAFLEKSPDFLNAFNASMTNCKKSERNSSIALG